MLSTNLTLYEIYKILLFINYYNFINILKNYKFEDSQFKSNLNIHLQIQILCK